MTVISVFGKTSVKEGPVLPNDECRASMNYWLTETPQEGCLVDVVALTATCKEAYENPFF